MTDIDINKAIEAQQSGASLEQLARADEISGWSREAATEKARAEGVDLTTEHWRVIDMLRATYLARGRAPHARILANMLDAEFAAAGGSKHLYQLFPGGPVTQGSRLAGVPAPHDSEDKSFGTSF